MKILLHCPFVLQTNTGITRYIFGLLRALGDHDRTNQYCCTWPPQAEWPTADLPPNFQPIPLTIHGGGGVGNPLARIVREVGFLRRIHRRTFSFDVFHSPFGYLPLQVPAPTVLTLPDLRALRLPRTFTPARGFFLRRMIPYSLRRATLTLAMSQATRVEILALVSGVRAERVRVAYPGVDARWFAKINHFAANETARRLGLTEKYVLAVGTREPHKNLPRLIEAFAGTRQELGENLQLCLVGGTFATGSSDDVARAIRDNSVGDAVVLPGILTDDDLRALYARAALLAFPSLYEGFGYPPLEAMAVGTPVVTSRASCLPEVVGDAAELVDPNDMADIARGLRAVLTNDDRRAELTASGSRRVRRYSWAVHAEQVVQAYADVIGR